MSRYTLTLTGMEPILKAVEDYMRCGSQQYMLPDFEEQIKHKAKLLTIVVGQYADGIAQAHVDIVSRFTKGSSL